MKKTFFLFSLLLLVQSHAFSQIADSLWEDNRRDSIIQYMSPLEYAFMMHEETKFMLRVPAIGVGAEVELLPYTTVMVEVDYNRRLNFSGELRWYYGSKRKGVRNMSGNYFAGGYAYNNLFSSTYHEDFIYARWGVQRRFLGNGLIDVGVNAGYRTAQSTNSYDNSFQRIEHFRLATSATLGLGFAFNKNKFIDRDRVCPVVKCYDVEKFLLKVNLTDLGTIDFSPSDKIFYANLRPSLAFEQKLFRSSFSLNVGANSFFSVSNISQGSDEIKKIEAGFSNLEFLAEGRWYYNLRRRMRNGKGGNGLSANYIAAGGRETVWSRFDNVQYFRPTYMFTTGVQRTIGNRLYFDVQSGVEMYENPYRPETEVYFILDIRAGIKF